MAARVAAVLDGRPGRLHGRSARARTGDLYAAACSWYVWPTPNCERYLYSWLWTGRLLMRGPVGLVCRAPDRYSGRCDVGVHPE